MFGFLRHECPPLQLYGKLPLAKDYLRLGMGEGAALALREWLDATFSGGAARGNPPELAWPTRFMIGDAWRGCLQGILTPSADAGGLRAFPFLMCVERKRKAVLADLQADLAGAASIWAQLCEHRQRSVAHADGKALLAATRGAQIDLQKAAPVPMAGVAAEAWLQGLWPGAGREGFEADLERLHAVAATGADTPVRLPLLPGCSQRQQVLTWLEVLERLGLLAPAVCPTLFFPESHAPQAVLPGAVEAAPSTPFMTVFRSPATTAHGAWLQAARADESLGEADLAGGRPLPQANAAPTSEGLPPLAASLRSAVGHVLRRLDPRS